MKATILLCISLSILNCSIANIIEEVRKDIPLKGSISVLSTPDLYNLTKIWSAEFCRLNPGVKVKVIKASEVSLGNFLNIRKCIGFVSNEYYATLNQEIWKIVIGRDIIVPIINSNNPFIDKINKQGISSIEIAQLFKMSGSKNWGTLLKGEQKTQLNYYMIDNESIISGVADFLNLDQVVIDGVKVKNGREMISSIQKDPYAIGFCKMIDILDFDNLHIVDHIKLLPIDRNGNGKIDYMENIYADMNVLSRGVWIGKYPKSLFSNIYSVSNVKPKNDIEIAFLRWVLSDGQQYLNISGYSDLVYSERKAKIDTLFDNQINLITTKDNYATSKAIILIAAISLISIIVLIIIIRIVKNTTAAVQDAIPVFSRVFDEGSVSIPRGLYYDKTHTWAFMGKDGMVKIGIDDFFQHISGPLTRVKMKNAGDKIRKGQTLFSVIQNGKQLNIYAPISGTIKKHNEILNSNSSIINSSPYSDGWVYMVEPTNWIREIQFLTMERKYREWLKSEFSRLKDFLAASLKPNTTGYAHVLQDGGELKDGILEDLGPEVWEEFQTKFIDTSK